MDIYAVSQDKCMLTIKDLGFGEMFRTSGRVITEKIDLSEACNRVVTFTNYLLEKDLVDLIKFH